MNKIIFSLLFVSLAACAKLPVETVTLTDAIIIEGKRMHQLNLVLLNEMFNDKREKIDAFIKNEYTPQYLIEFKAKIPTEEDIDYEKHFPEMVQSIIPQIRSRRDMMQSALESQRIKLITKLDSDYKLYEEALLELKALIESGIRVNEERKKAFQQIKNITDNKIDLNKFETELDKFIIKSGDISENINELNNSVNSLLNN